MKLALQTFDAAYTAKAVPVEFAASQGSIPNARIRPKGITYQQAGA
jgi:hypothetical protein